MTHLPGTDRIVVGMDGTAASVAALRWAAGEAELRHAEIVAVRAWRASREWLAPYAVAAARPSPGQDRERARRGLAADVLRALGPAPRVQVHQELVRGEGAQALITRAAGARLLVLGGWRGEAPPEAPLGLGPVVSACLRHAPCPVVIVPPFSVPERPVHDDSDGRWETERAGRTARDRMTLASADSAVHDEPWNDERRGRRPEPQPG